MTLLDVNHPFQQIVFFLHSINQKYGIQSGYEKEIYNLVLTMFAG